MTSPRRPFAAVVLPVALAALAVLASCASESPAAPAGSGAGAASASTSAAPASPAAPAITPPSALEDAYAALGRAGTCHVFALDPAASTVRIHVFRDGRAARLGHNHVLAAPRFRGFACVPAAPADARFDLVFRLDELTFDDPAHRALLGPAYASLLSAEAIAGTREHMLGESNMQADRFPEVRIHAVQVSGEGPRLAARIAVTLHGQTREQSVPLRVAGLPGQLQVAGSFVLRQTDFGIAPYSVAGGLLAVKDEVVVDFELAGR